ncbi:hypothetical protein GF339_13795 [candidate division KSB3 bacterium]|uniref:DUF5666 domain-containing protein n=1 Tax=candidate division KSB3 bacterium TaxID=2044937 RepID=A0A9D5JWY7_9BACT|nr:hypothetical protein [candidate division KSB3 bacterium]MBD3325653.1 hypothetical protein [candidate division KSB3 bacterium]
MKKVLILLLVLAVNCLALSALADTIEMKDGRLIEGKYMGGTQQTIRFQADGKVAVYPIRKILAVTFSSAGPPVSQVTPTPSAVPTPSSRWGELIIEKGTTIPVRMTDSLSVNTSKEGDQFKAVLDTDLLKDHKLAAPKGSEVHGEVIDVTRDRYGDRLAITLREMVVRGQVVPLHTTIHVVENKPEERVLDVGPLNLKIVPRERARTPQIGYRTRLEFELTEPATIDISR